MKQENLTTNQMPYVDTDKRRLSADLSNATVIILDTKSKSVKFWSESQRFYWLICLFTGQIAAHSTRALMPICAVAISKEFLWNKSQMGAVLGCFFWGYMFIQVFTGSLADIVGGEAVLLFGAFGWASVTILYAVVDQIGFLSNSGVLLCMLLLRLMNGVFQGFHTPSVASLISSRVDLDRRGLTFSMQHSGAYFGTIISGSLGSLLLHCCGWRTCFLVFGLVSMVWVYITKTYLCIATTPSQLEVVFNFRSLFVSECKHFLAFLHSLVSSEDGKDDIAVADGRQKSCESPPSKMQTVPWRVVLSSVAFWSMMLGQFAYGYSHFIILSWMPTYFQEVHLTSKGWVFNVLPWLVTIPFSIFGGYLSDKLIRTGHSVTLVRKLMETLSQLGTALFLHLLTYSGTYETSLALMTLAVAFSGFHCSGIVLNPLDLAPNHGGALFGIMNMAGAFPGFLGVYVSGFLLEYFRSWALVFNHAAVICVLGWVSYLLLGSSLQIV